MQTVLGPSTYLRSTRMHDIVSTFLMPEVHYSGTETLKGLERFRAVFGTIAPPYFHDILCFSSLGSLSPSDLQFFYIHDPVTGTSGR